MKIMPPDSPLRRCCLLSEAPRQLDVSRCTKHQRIELWVNHAGYYLTDELAEQLGRALLAAAANEGGSPEPAGDRP